MLKPEFVRRTMEAAERLVDATAEPGPAMLIGTIHRSEGGAIYNAFLLADGGRVVGRTLKHELPNYGTFDEKRVFASGPAARADRVSRASSSACRSARTSGRNRSARHLAEAGAEFLLVPNGSPFELDKDEQRQRLVRERASSQTGLPLAYLNRVGGQDELAFDGSSFVINADGELVVQMPDWEEAFAAHRLGAGGRTAGAARRAPGMSSIAFPADIYRAMMVALARLCRRAMASPA